MWISITDSAGSKYGAPIRTVTRWNNTARLDKAGTFAFEMPAGDSLAALLASKREAHCYDIIGGSVVEVGAGIIDKAEAVIAPQRSTMLRVSGGDLMRELTYRTVGNLGLFAPGQTVTPSSVQHHDPDGSTPNTVMTDAFDDNLGTQHDLSLESDEYIYIRYTSNTAGAIFDLDAGTVNDNVATMTVQYFDGGAWQGMAGYSDGTADGGATLAKDGTMAWTRPADAETMVHNGEEGYWIRMTPSADLDEVGFIEVDVIGDGPTTTGLADIMAYAPAGWALDGVKGYAATENTAYLFFAGENVLEALKILAEHTGEHFYLGAGKKIVWVQDDPVADPTACGYRAVPMYGGMVKTNPLVCLIQSLAEIEDGYKRCSRVYPHGAGMGTGRLSLADATDSPGAGYTLAASDNYVKHDVADAALQIDKDITWPEIGRIEEDAVHSVHASNQLLASAVEYLSRHYAAQTSYSLTVVGLDGTVDPGETIPVTYWEYRDGSAVLDIDATLIILEAATAIDSQGIRTVALTVATTDAWPESEGRVVAEHLRKAKRATGGAGPGGTPGGAGGTGDIHVVTHVKHRGDLDTLIRFLDDQITMDVGGYPALFVDRGGNANTILGTRAGEDLEMLGGQEIVAIGNQTMRDARGVTGSTAVGFLALRDDGKTSGGGANSAFGNRALEAMDTGTANFAGGYDAMRNFTSGSGSVAIGGEALKSTTTGTGSDDVAIGYLSMTAATSASDNVVIGSYAGVAMTTASQHVIIGYEAGVDMVTGTGCILIGYQAGTGETGSNKLYIENSNSATPLIYGEFDNDFIELFAAGTAKANHDVLRLTNTGNDADMDATETSILFNQYYYDAATPAKVDSGRITVGTETDWTSTAATQDSYMAFEVALDGTVTERMRLVSSGDLLMGTEDGGGKLNFDEGTAIADGIVWGSDANKVTLYRSADDMLKTDDSLTITLGLNIGTATGATIAGQIAALNATIETTGSILGLSGRWTKTAGATDEDDVFYGFDSRVTMNDADSTIGTMEGLLFIATLTDGTVGADGSDRYIMGIEGIVDCDAGTVWGDIEGIHVAVDIEAGMTAINGDVRGLNLWIDADQDPTGSVYMIYLNEGTNVDYGIYQNGTAVNIFGGDVVVGALNVSETRLGSSTETAGREGISMWHDGTMGKIACVDAETAYHTLQLRVLNVLPAGNKDADLGIEDTAWDDCWADDFHNQADLFYLDSRRNERGVAIPIDDLAVLRAIKPSGEYDTRTGMPLIDDATLPTWALTRNKITGEISRSPDGKPWLSNKMLTSLSWGAIRQLDGYRLVADAEREAIRAEIAGLQERLDDMARRG